MAHYSRKLTATQLNYTTAERELLTIAETLKEFRNTLLGQKIIVHTDHKNLTYKVFNTARVMRWRLILEEYRPDLQHLKGDKNVVADALSRLHLLPPTKSECNLDIEDIPTTHKLAEAFAHACKEISKDDLSPLSFKSVQRAQQTDVDLLRKVETSRECEFRSFHGGDKARKLICTPDGHIVILEVLQRE